MNRIFKLSVLPLPTAAGVAVHFSSYPGVLNSMDDFYSVSDTQLTVTLSGWSPPVAAAVIDQCCRIRPAIRRS